MGDAPGNQLLKMEQVMNESPSNPALRVVVIVLAGIGALALLAVAGMAMMHGSMMGGSFGC